MSKHITTGIPELDDIIPVFQHAIRETAKQVGKEIEIAYENSIFDFYGSYTPKRYKRLHQLYYGSDAYNNRVPLFKHFGTSGTAVSYIAGIHIGAEFIPGDPYSRPGHAVSKYWVFNNSFTKGIHGFTRGMIQKHNNEISELKAEYGNYISNAFQEWYVKRNSIPKSSNYHEVPYTNFKRDFRKKTSEGYIDSVFSSYFPG